MIPWYVIQEFRPGQVLKFKSPSSSISCGAQIATDMWMFKLLYQNMGIFRLSVISAANGRWFIFIHLSSNQPMPRWVIGSVGENKLETWPRECQQVSLVTPKPKVLFCSMIRSWRFSRIYMNHSWQNRSKKSLSSAQTAHLWSSLCSPCVRQCFPWPQQFLVKGHPKRSPKGKNKSKEGLKWFCPGFFPNRPVWCLSNIKPKKSCSSCLDPDFQRQAIGLASCHSVINFDIPNQWTSEIPTRNSGHWLTWPFPFYWSSYDNWLVPGRKGHSSQKLKFFPESLLDSSPLVI